MARGRRMTPCPIPIAVRAYTVRCAAPANRLLTAGANGTKRPHHPNSPKHVLVFDTETTADETQRLMFGGYRVLRWNNGASDLIDEGLFHADNLHDYDPGAVAELTRYAAHHSIALRSRRQFVDKVFRPVALDMKGMIVGFNLPFDISRIAVGSGEARGASFRGGFSFVLWDYFDKKRGEWAEHPYRPRVCVKSLDSKRALIGFARPMRADGGAPFFRGNFFDLRTGAYALSGESHSLQSACIAFGVTHGKLAV